MLLESLLFIGLIIMLCVLMFFLHVVSAICGIPPVICLETNERRVTIQRAIKFGVGDQGLELLHEERSSLVEVVWIKCR